MRIAILILGLTGCGGDDRDGPNGCDPSKRDGTYLAEFTTVSGNCGDVPSQVLRLNGMSTELAAGCELLQPDVWRNEGCTVERTSRCVTDQGVIVKTTGLTTQEDADGDVLTGTATVELSGTASCVGTYRVKYTRQ